VRDRGARESGTAGADKAVDNYVENIEGEWRRATPDRWWQPQAGRL